MTAKTKQSRTAGFRRLGFEPLECRLLLSVACSAGQAAAALPASPAVAVIAHVNSYAAPALADGDADGLLDVWVGEKTADGLGKVRFYRNTGTADAPRYDDFSYVRVGSRELEVDAQGCLGAAPRVADLDGDGRLDPVLGLADGRVLFYRGTPAARAAQMGPALAARDAANARAAIVAYAGSADAAVRRARAPTFDAPVELAFGSPGAKQPIDVGRRAMPEVADFNADGRPDLLVGALDGKIRVYLNRADGGVDLRQEIVLRQGSATETIYGPCLSEAAARSPLGPFHAALDARRSSQLIVPSGRSSPCLVDVDADGLADLVTGNTEGELYVYLNVGTTAAPRFGLPVPWSPTGETIDLDGAARSRPAVADVNADGVVDLVLGAADGTVRLYLAPDPSPLALLDASGTPVEITFDENTLVVGAATWCGACNYFKQWLATPSIAAGLDGLRLVFAFGDELGEGAGRVASPEYLQNLPGEAVFLGPGSAAVPSAFPTVYDPLAGRFTSQTAFEWVEDWLGGDATEGDGDTTPPVVQDVLVRGGDWTEAFLDQLDTAGLGDPSIPRLGCRVPEGAAQLDPLAWVNVDRIVVVFSEDVTVDQGDLELIGANVPSYTFAGFDYDATTHAATWTLAEPIGADRLLLVLDAGTGGVADASGNPLDGDWVNGEDAYPSGNAAPGGDFRFALALLPGDADADGEVDFDDVQIARSHFGTAGGALPAQGDFDGDGDVDFGDFQNVKLRFADSLPPGPFDFFISGPSGTIDDNTPEVTWDSSWGAQTYDLVVSTLPDCSVVTQQATDLSVTYYTLSELAEGTYYICVKAKDGVGLTTDALNNGLSFSVDIAPSVTHKIFATSYAVNISANPNVPPPSISEFGSLEAADWICNYTAIFAGLISDWNGVDPIYKAILSTSLVNAKDRIVIEGPVYNTHGDLVANDSADMWDGSLANAVGYNEYGAAFSGVTPVWAGTNLGGLVIASENCTDWTDPSGFNSGKIGNATVSDGDWIDDNIQTCNMTARLYCVSPAISE